jgi:hypothetical protein
MSTDPHHGAPAHGELPRHRDVSFEGRDVTVRTIYWYLIVLAISVAASFLVCVYILRFVTNYVQESDVPMMPARAAMGPEYRTMPPEPRLQGVPGHDTDPQQDRRDKVRADTEANEKYGWVDQSSGIAQIPVKEAMKMIAEKGLPANTPAEKKK